MANGIDETDRLYATLSQPRTLVTTLSQEEAASWLGSAFDATHVYKNVAPGAVIRFQYTVPQLSSGVVVQLVSRELEATAGPLDIQIYTNPTGLVKGSNIQQGCLRRLAPKASVVDITQVVSTTSPGLLILEDYAGGQPGGPGGKSVSSGAARSGGMFIIQAPGSTTYYELTNNAGTEIARIRLRFEWLQVPLDFLNLDGFLP